MQDEDVLDAERLPELLLAALEDVVGMRERQEAFLCAEELLEEALVGAGRGVAGRELEALQAREERGEAFGARRHRQDPSVELRDRVVPDPVISGVSCGFGSYLSLIATITHSPTASRTLDTFASE